MRAVVAGMVVVTLLVVVLVLDTVLWCLVMVWLKMRAQGVVVAPQGERGDQT